LVGEQAVRACVRSSDTAVDDAVSRSVTQSFSQSSIDGRTPYGVDRRNRVDIAPIRNIRRESVETTTTTTVLSGRHRD